MTLTTEYNKLLEDIVYEIRIELAQSYDIDNHESKYYKYSGLCDISCSMLREKLSQSSMDGFCKVIIYHGEQKHSPIIDSKYWYYQHTWAGLQFSSGELYYIDITASQFQWLYDDIPTYYISTKPPKWFYWDRNNPQFNGITKKINKLIRFKKNIILPNGNPLIVSHGIVEIIQYNIWGYISNIIRKAMIKIKLIK